MIRTIDDLDDYMLLHGHKRTGDFILNDKLINCIVDINNLDIPEINNNKIKSLSKFLLKKHAYTFFNDYYNIHEIGYLSDNKLKALLNNKEISTTSDISDIYNKSAKMINPFKLPINYKLDGINGGTLVTQSVLTEDETLHKELLNKLNLYFTNIELPKRTTEVSTSSYIHEITHSQLESHKGIIEDFNNVEVLSIFNELLYAYNYCEPIIFKKLLTNILNSLFLSFNSIYEYKEANFIKSVIGGIEYGDFDYHTDIKYLISTLKALKLFIKCTGDDRVTKYHIINLINKVFNGDMTVEELLDKIEINQDNILESNYINKLLK